MTVLGIHDLVDGITSHTRAAVSSDGGLSLILIDGLLLVPLAFAAFFYPVTAALIGAAVAATVTVVAVTLSRARCMHPTRESTREEQAQHHA